MSLLFLLQILLILLWTSLQIFFYASPRQVKDEQVDDELPHLGPRSPAPIPPKYLAQDIPSRHSTWVKSIPAHLLDYHCYTALAILYEPHTYYEASITLYGKLQ